MNFLRSAVSGKRNRLQDGDFNLDLTYITPRVLAMSFPAGTTMKKMYRNNINDVGRYLQERHNNNYWVFNCSGIAYDTLPL